MFSLCSAKKRASDKDLPVCKEYFFDPTFTDSQMGCQKVILNVYNHRNLYDFFCLPYYQFRGTFFEIDIILQWTIFDDFNFLK